MTDKKYKVTVELDIYEDSFLTMWARRFDVSRSKLLKLMLRSYIVAVQEKEKEKASSSDSNVTE